MKYTIYELVWYFFLYGFLGWCCEVGYAVVTLGHFVNRGFLTGPICPIYGFGIVIVLLCLTPIKDNLILLFLGSTLLLSATELITGVVMEHLFNEKWWDYTDMPFNLGGYICLKFSLLFGALGVLVVCVIHPLIQKLVNVIPMGLGIPLLCVFAAAFLADVSVTVATILHLRDNLRVLTEIQEKLQVVSGAVGGGITVVTKGAEKGAEKGSERVHDLWDEFGDTRKAGAEKLQRGQRRLMEAFPQLQQTGKYHNAVTAWKARLAGKDGSHHHTKPK